MKVFLSVIAFVTLTLCAQAQTPGGFRVFDGTGKLLGNFMAVMPCRADSECGCAAVLIAGGITAALPISSDDFNVPEFYFTHQPKFFHTSSDCSGQRFMGFEAADKSGLLPAVES